MAITRNGYGQLELNKVAFRRDGRVEAQMPFDTSADTTFENGMVVIVDKATGLIKKGAIGEGALYGILYTSEELYDSRKPGLKNFGVEVKDGKANGPEGYDVYGRIGYLAEGDTFTTNTVVTAEYAKGDKVYAGATGEWTATANENGPIGVVAEVTTMPDGQDAIKIVITKA